MNSTMLSILNQESNSFIQKIRDNLESTGTTATGKTANSMYFKLTEEGTKIMVEVFGKPFMAVVETGRKPTPDKKPSRAMIDNITEWVSARGKPDSMIWAVATKIQKEGTELFKKGGRKDIYSNEIEGFVDAIGSAITKEIADEYLNNMVITFK